MGDLVELEQARRQRRPQGLNEGVAPLHSNAPRRTAEPDAAQATSTLPDRSLRDGFGRFRSETAALLDLIRDVAIWAASHLYRTPIEPCEVTEEKWDQARRAFETRMGRIAHARQLCVRLRQMTGNHYRWPEWLALALGEDKDLSNVLAGLAARTPLVLNDEHVRTALLAIAGRLGKRSFSPPEYDRALERWLIDEERAGRGRHTALERLPNSEQIIHACGSWAVAMELAGLQPPNANDERAEGCPVPDAIAYHYAQLGFLPTRRQLDAFADTRGFSLARISGTGWHTWLARAEERISECPELPPPPRYGTAPPDNWEPIEIDVQLPTRKMREYPTRKILEAFQDYLASLDGGPPTHRNYREWSTGNRSRPSLNSVLRRGSFEELSQILSNPNWRANLPAR